MITFDNITGRNIQEHNPYKFLKQSQFLDTRTKDTNSQNFGLKQRMHHKI